MAVPDHPTLRALLAAPTRPEGTMTYGELQGFLFAVLSAPDLVPPSEWIPQIFNEGQPEYESLDHLQAAMDDIMALNNEIAAPLPEDGSALPPGVVFAEPTMTNFEEDAAIGHWARGFIRGHTWLEESWEGLVPDEADEEFGMLTMALSFFASKRLAQALCDEVGGDDLSSLAEAMREAFPLAAAEYSRIGRALSRIIATAEEDISEPATSTKVGRNDPCPCGSGHKFKKCCGAPPRAH